MTTNLKARLKAGEKLLGAWTMTDSPDNAEVMAQTGLDFVLMDHEHGQATLPAAIAQLRAIKGTGCAGLMRVPWNDMIYIKRVLDAGIQGIMVPQVNTPEEARAVVAACRYPPLGIRGAAGGTRASSYGVDMGYFGRAADELLVMVQVETPQAVENAAAIAAVDGVDVVFIGPRDLSAYMGKLNKFDDPELRALITMVEQATLKSGKALGTIAPTGALARQLFDQGYSLLISGSDMTHLRASIVQMMKEAGRG
ncbi:HpcH/HpaI aldolase family protein [Dongia deserti]|uniref:HpcH/HpaI aldolase family protein n=1 Tax=Dongia deserti TaxID=2268030 RepID=UPI0013C41719|nr:aldolase/citrate lyase family protein [Dongia deserti]